MNLSIYLKTKSKVFIGYDKGKEIAPQPLPEPFKGYYGLRLEWRILKGLKKIYGYFPAPFELTEKKGHSRLVKEWQEAYFKIPKEPRIFVDMNNLSPLDFKNALALHGLKHLGLSNVQAFIEAGAKGGGVKRHNSSRMRAQVKELLNDDRLTISTELTEEVDAAVLMYR